MPTLIVWGANDRIIPLVHAFRAHAAIPNSRLEVMEGVGHFPHVEDPIRFVEVLKDFLHTTEPSQVHTPRDCATCSARGPRSGIAGLSRTTRGPVIPRPDASRGPRG